MHWKALTNSNPSSSSLYLAHRSHEGNNLEPLQDDWLISTCNITNKSKLFLMYRTLKEVFTSGHEDREQQVDVINKKLFFFLFFFTSFYLFNKFYIITH